MTAQREGISLILKLLIGIAVGVIIGYWGHKTVMQAVGSIKIVSGQFIFYAVPLVIIGFIAPSITRLGENASKMLGFTVAIAYLSSVGAAFFAIFLGYLLIPHLSGFAEARELRELPEVLFNLEIPPLMPVMTALVTAIVLGLTTLWTKAETFHRLLGEFEQIVIRLVRGLVIPLLPILIAATFAQLSYEGSFTRHLPIFLKILVIAIGGHYVWLAFLYFVAAVISRRNPFQVLRHYPAAYFTAMGTMSSAATLPVALAGARRSRVLSRDVVNFVIPMGATVHLCGSVLTETLFCMAIYNLIFGHLPALGLMILFVLLLGVFAVGAPGVPGGTVMASLGLVMAVLGFNSDATALLLAIFALQDSFGTACNITGDGAIALMMDGIFNPKAENLQTGED